MPTETLTHSWVEMTLVPVDVFPHEGQIHVVHTQRDEEPKPMVVCRVCGEPPEEVYDRPCRVDED